MYILFLILKNDRIHGLVLPFSSAISDKVTIFRKAYCATNERIFTPIFLLLIKWFVDID